MADEPWSDDELEACVAIYADVVKRGGCAKNMSKDVFIARGRKAAPSRNDKAILYRMQNISHLMQVNGKSFVLGWKPKENVGTGMVPRIEQIMRKYDLI